MSYLRGKQNEKRIPRRPGSTRAFLNYYDRALSRPKGTVEKERAKSVRKPKNYCWRLKSILGLVVG